MKTADTSLRGKVEMKVAVVSAIRAGSHKAATINVVKMAEGFARCGNDVCLVSLTGNLKNEDELRSLYGRKYHFY